MLYVTGVHALNLEDSLETCGDWHNSGIRWDNVRFRETEGSIFGDWGIEGLAEIPEHGGKYMFANTLRAVLDLMEEGVLLGWLKGFRNDFFCTDKYNDVFFEKVYELRKLNHWEGINELMTREFMQEWLDYLDGRV